jgi:hypothetical protein
VCERVCVQRDVREGQTAHLEVAELRGDIHAVQELVHAVGQKEDKQNISKACDAHSAQQTAPHTHDKRLRASHVSCFSSLHLRKGLYGFRFQSPSFAAGDMMRGLGGMDAPSL